MPTNYDAWLTTDRSAEAQDEAADALIANWIDFAYNHAIPERACEDDYDDPAARAIYLLWEKTYEAVQQWHADLQAAAWDDTSVE